MEVSQWVQILKAIGFGILTGGMVVYFLNRRMERYGPARISDRHGPSMIGGIEEFMRALMKTVGTIDDTNERLQESTLTRRGAQQAKRLIDRHMAAVLVHEIYLGHILPFGVSNENVGFNELSFLRDVFGLIETHGAEYLSENRDLADRYHVAVQELHRRCQDMTVTSEQVIADIQEEG